MEKLLLGLIFVVWGTLRLLGCLIFIIWKFELNPILEKGTKNGYYYEAWDYKLWDWFWYGVKPEYRKVK